MTSPPRRVGYHEPRQRPMRRERTPEELAAIRKVIAETEYLIARDAAKRGEGPWPDVPENARPATVGELAHPTNALVLLRDMAIQLEPFDLIAGTPFMKRKRAHFESLLRRP